MGGLGVHTATLDADQVTHLLTWDIPVEVKRVLEIRQILGSASVKKLFSIQRYLAPDNRIRGLFTYCGAERTGRFAGGGPQPHNMPAGGPPVSKCPRCGAVQWARGDNCRACGSPGERESTDWGVESIDLALADISTLDLSLVESRWGDPLTAISGCLRGLYTAAPGHELISSDYCAIEAVVLAVLAGEEWRVDVFRTHGKIYETSAAKISGIPFEDFLAYKRDTGQHHPLRKKIGKVAELASGYGGWIGAWKNFGADKFMADDEIKRSILKWRDESPMIVEFWGGQYRKHPTRWEFIPGYYGLEGAAVLAILEPGKWLSYRQISYGVFHNVLYCRLPSGRMLAYHEPHLEQTWDSMRELWYYKISFMGWNSNPLNGPTGWRRIETYSGKLTENVVQATARDILTHAMPNLENAGYPLVLHVHDETCSEVPVGFGSVEQYEQIMKILPAWAEGWPIKAAGGWRGRRYRK
jgi:DNA polymerase